MVSSIVCTGDFIPGIFILKIMASMVDINFNIQSIEWGMNLRSEGGNQYREALASEKTWKAAEGGLNASKSEGGKDRKRQQNSRISL
jgi:hypothetical protein